MPLDIDDPRPTYLQLADTLKADVADGRYGVGDRLPAVRTIAEEFEVSNATAARAVGVLQDDGVVVSRPGLGTVVRERPVAAAPSIQDQLDDLRGRVEALESRDADR